MSQANPTVIQINIYAENYVLYGDQSRAWRVAFPESKAKAESVHARASKLHSIGKVQLRIDEIRSKLVKQTEEEFSITVSDLKKMLVTAAMGGLKSKGKSKDDNQGLHNIAGAVSAITEINRMDGNHYQYKTDSDDDDDPQPLTINFEVIPAIKEIKITNAGS